MIDDTTGDLTPRGRIAYSRITGAAADLIYGQGLSNTTLNDVRRAASVSGSQLTHYFTDRRALVRGVIAWRRDQVMTLSTDGGLGRLYCFSALQGRADRHVHVPK